MNHRNGQTFQEPPAGKKLYRSMSMCNPDLDLFVVEICFCQTGKRSDRSRPVLKHRNYSVRQHANHVPARNCRSSCTHSNRSDKAAAQYGHRSPSGLKTGASAPTTSPIPLLLPAEPLQKNEETLRFLIRLPLSDHTKLFLSDQFNTRRITQFLSS